jgi:hypothetical protein
MAKNEGSGQALHFFYNYYLIIENEKAILI